MSSRPGPEELTSGSVCRTCLEARGETPPEFYVKVEDRFVRVDSVRILFCNNCGKQIVSGFTDQTAHETQGMLEPADEQPDTTRNPPHPQEAPAPPAERARPAGPPPSIQASMAATEPGTAPPSPTGQPSAAPLPVPGPSQAPPPSPPPPAQPRPQSPTAAPMPAPPDKKKGGFLGKLFSKKREDEVTRPTPRPVPHPPPSTLPLGPPPSASLPPPAQTSPPLSPPPDATPAGNLEPPAREPATKTIKRPDNDEYLPPVLPF